MKRGRRFAVIAAVVLALVAADSVAGIWYRTGTEATVHVVPARSGTARQVTVAFPGFTMPGKLLAEAFTPHLGDDDALVVIGYAERGIDIDAVYRQILDDVRRTGAPRLRVYGASMGGICAKEFLDRYRRDGAPLGKVVLVLDTAPSGADDIRKPQALFAVAARYRGGPLTTAAWALASRVRPHPPTGPGANPRTVDAAHHAGAWAGMPAVTSQAAHLRDFPPLSTGDLVPVAERVVYLRGRPTGPDPLVDVDRAVSEWRRAFPSLVVTTFQRREERWHLPLIECPQETVQHLLAA